jgi:hypothetical protein
MRGLTVHPAFGACRLFLFSLAGVITAPQGRGLLGVLAT